MAVPRWHGQTNGQTGELKGFTSAPYKNAHRALINIGNSEQLKQRNARKVNYDTE